MEKSERNKSIVEFLAGGLFAFSVFTVVSFVTYFAGNDGVFHFFEKLAFASAELSAPTYDENRKNVQETENTPLEQRKPSESNYSYLSDRLMELSQSTGWGPTEAPKETEEPEDGDEEPISGLKYPEELKENGGRIIRRTYSYNPSSTCIELPGGGMLRNSTDVDIDYIAQQVSKELELKISLDGSPQVLIMHTHTTECYEPYARERFDADFTSRTTDLDKSVAAVGGEIAKVLEAAGIGVIHDVTLHDYPKYTGAYDRSSATVEKILKDNPSIKIVLDIHRDAIESEGVRYAPVCEVDGKNAAQVMIICGSMNVPQFRYNLRFASKLQSKMESDYPGFTRPVLFAERNYNQELTHASLLVEMGSDSNSLDEALYSGKLLGMSLSELLLEYVE